MLLHEFVKLADRHRRQFVDIPIPEADRQRFRTQTRTVAGMAFVFDAVALEFFGRSLRLGAFIIPRQPGDDALVAPLILGDLTAALKQQRHSHIGTFHKDAFLLFR